MTPRSSTSCAAAGHTSVEYTKDADGFANFQCLAVCRHAYKYCHLAAILRALAHSRDSSITVHEGGFLAIQCMAAPPTARLRPPQDAAGMAGDIVDGEAMAFMEFYLAPLVADDDDTADA